MLNEFLVYAFAGIGVVASAWFVTLGLAKLWAYGGSDPHNNLEDRVAELERRVP